MEEPQSTILARLDGSQPVEVRPNLVSWTRFELTQRHSAYFYVEKALEFLVLSSGIYFLVPRSWTGTLELVLVLYGIAIARVCLLSSHAVQYEVSRGLVTERVFDSDLMIEYSFSDFAGYRLETLPGDRLNPEMAEMVRVIFDEPNRPGAVRLILPREPAAARKILQWVRAALPETPQPAPTLRSRIVGHAEGRYGWR